ncbi:MAG TPA: TetR/AcrR family transcriptional regulator C-terminal domain-containing protein [Candidatus Eubacterium avistercoris]|uniref:TetR/AcrR family transcriptional regulator C-terminal domain-containing protein n=1 Tax=Candidatus Eubacterium avistercoris TaxID=2838567 RepID=A0A9D2D308_9FIRM|nr:TetR/AcrR family transcriptional regulator C-terminal domain-containing protein [Candidatus Eubacterium avistercoris]
MIQKSRKSVDDLLAQSFKELVCQQPIEKITIKQITDRAGVIRPTFYNHFEDKYNLLEWIMIKDIVTPVQPLLSNGMINEAMILIFHNMRKEKDFYMHASKLEGQNSFRGMIERGIQLVLGSMIVDQMGTKKPINRWLTPEHLAEYYSQSITYVLMTWIQGGMEMPPEELAQVYDFIISRSLSDVLEDMWVPLKEK